MKLKRFQCRFCGAYCQSPTLGKARVALGRLCDDHDPDPRQEIDTSVQQILTPAEAR